MIDTQRAAVIQAVLEGVPLPARRSTLVDYARQNDPSVADELLGLPDQQFERLDEVGELLTRAPAAHTPVPRQPVPESGQPPGGSDYVKPFPKDTGLVRHDAPRQNPPQKAIEQASERQKKQKAKQSG